MPRAAVASTARRCTLAVLLSWAAVGRAARPAKSRGHGNGNGSIQVALATNTTNGSETDSYWNELVSWTAELAGVGGGSSGNTVESTTSTTTTTTTLSASVRAPARLAYIAEKLRIQRESISQYVGTYRHPGVDRVRPAKAKVAFLVLTETDISFPSIWDRFFGAAPRHQFSIYVHHSKVKKKESHLSKWGAITVPWHPTEWCALLGLEVVMLGEALKNSDNTQFVFVSESTIPLKSFGYVYGQLVERTPFTSKFCLATPADYPSFSRQVLQIELAGGCYFRDFYRVFDRRTLKHHQWVVLSRAHALTVVRQAPTALDLFEGTWRSAAPDLRHAGEGCSDESALLTALLIDLELRGDSTNNTWADLTRLGVEQQCLTFARWRGCLSGSDFERGAVAGFAANISALWSAGGSVWQLMTAQGFMFGKLKEVVNGFPYVFTEIDLEYLQSLVATGFMFGRKFVPGTNVTYPDGTKVPLEQVLPTLWHVNSSVHPEMQVWSHLETSGKPAPLVRP